MSRDELTRIGKSSGQIPAVRPASMILPVARRLDGPLPALTPEREDLGPDGALDWWTSGRPGQSGEEAILAEVEGMFDE